MLCSLNSYCYFRASMIMIFLPQDLSLKSFRGNTVPVWSPILTNTQPSSFLFPFHINLCWANSKVRYEDNVCNDPNKYYWLHHIFYLTLYSLLISKTKYFSLHLSCQVNYYLKSLINLCTLSYTLTRGMRHLPNTQRDQGQSSEPLTFPILLSPPLPNLNFGLLWVLILGNWTLVMGLTKYIFWNLEKI